MPGQDDGKANPFQWYVGRTVSLRGRRCSVEKIEVSGHELSFVLKDSATGELQRVDPVALVSATLIS